MNLNAYDPLETINDYWIWIPYKRLYLKNLKYRKYYCLLCRYDRKYRDYDYFLYMSDNEIQINNAKTHCTNKNKSGTIKIDLAGVWKELNIDISYGNKKVDVELVEENTDGEIYQINVNP